MKRVFDFSIAIGGLLVFAPLLIPFMLLIWAQDHHSPLYITPRAGKRKKPFNMIKLRSMVINADKNGGSSTKSDDERITAVGRIIRRFKIDELLQLWNVARGHMSLVGPRPNVMADVARYTNAEQQLLDCQPGITDFSSIVFSDEGEILKGSPEPDLKYNQIIRPWKSRLGLVYVNNQNLFLDMKLIFLTIIAIISKKAALRQIRKILVQLNADNLLIQMASRHTELFPYPPPGSERIANSHD